MWPCGACCFLAAWRSADDGVDDISGDIGQSEVAAGVAEGELFVIESEEVEEGGMEIMDMDAIMDGAEPEFVRFAPGHSTANTAPGEPCGEAIVVVIASGAIFGGGGASKFTSPEDERVFEQSALFEV
ncbi:MAG: hypothetical protein RL215_2563 [Planctomycetota bacterium]